VNYLDSLADKVRQAMPPDLVPDDSHDLFLMYALLVRVKGLATTAEDVHDAWTAWMAMRGETHESMRPFDQLSPDVQSEDDPFLAAIRTAASA
jgi:hypothetical protein